jgi:TPR repeat protein
MRVLSSFWAVGLILCCAVFSVQAEAPARCEGLAAPFQTETLPENQYQGGVKLIKEKCPDQAMELWQKAAEKNHAEAILQMAFLYQGGDRGLGHTRANPPKAFPYFVKAANLGDANAMVMVAFHYEAGPKFLAKDPEKAWDWYIRAANQGNQLAIQRVAKAYQNGEMGQTISPEKAALWAKKVKK